MYIYLTRYIEKQNIIIMHKFCNLKLTETEYIITKFTAGM